MDVDRGIGPGREIEVVDVNEGVVVELREGEYGGGASPAGDIAGRFDGAKPG